MFYEILHKAASGRLTELRKPIDFAASRYGLMLLLMVTVAIGACQPTVKVEAPQEPITINLNIKLDADVRLKLEEEAEEEIEANPDIF
ncbi:MAG: YnbE family lipoprotein [Pseudomonadota bacterium]